MFVRRRHAVAALVAALLLTSGCGSPASPPASPTTATTPSPADSDAAAEATYRAYVDALNAVDLADPSTFEPVYALTTGEVQEADRRNLTRYNAEDVTLSGASIIISLNHDAESRLLQACLDVSAVELTAPDGASLVDPDRRAIQSLIISFDDSASRITHIEAGESSKC